MDVEDTPAAREFQRALVFSFTVRQTYGANIWPAFREFVSEPDIVGHWETLGPDAVADMIASATALVSRARLMDGGGNLDSLPLEIRHHPEYGPLVDAARVLADAAHEGDTVAQAECVRLVHEIDTPDAVGVFAALVMSVFPPPGAAK